MTLSGDRPRFASGGYVRGDRPLPQRRLETVEAQPRKSRRSSASTMRLEGDVVRLMVRPLEPMQKWEPAAHSADKAVGRVTRFGIIDV